MAGRRQEELLSAMRKHGLSKKHRRDAWIWWRVASTFEHDYSGDPRHLFEQFGYDAPRLFTAMGAAFKKKFPYLSGPKILPLWLRMLHDVCKIPFKGLNKIPIPVDIHICRASLALGVLQGKYSGSISDIFSAIDEAWRQGCEGLPFYRLQVDEPLWHQSKNGCTHRPKSSCLPEDCPQYIACPVARYCITGKVSVTSNRVEIDT